jgi:hypothetical protein
MMHVETSGFGTTFAMKIAVLVPVNDGTDFASMAGND